LPRTVRAQPLTFQAKFFLRGGVAPAPPANTTHTPRGICFKRGWRRVGFFANCARYPWFCGCACTSNRLGELHSNQAKHYLPKNRIIHIIRIIRIIFPPKISHYASLSNHSKFLRVRLMRIMRIMRFFFLS
jgi:hypothetical protein